MPGGDGIEVHVHGGAELVEGTARLIGKIAEGAPKAMEPVAADVAARVRSRVPRGETGDLAAGVLYGVIDGGAYVGYSDAVAYAGWIDFGGERVGNRGGVASRDFVRTGRYLFPAIEDAQEKLATAAERAVDDQIGAMTWKAPSS